MVKGMTRRVVVVKSPDKKLFEEAVFFLCDDADHGISCDQIVAEAQSVAGGFTRESLRERKRGLLRDILWSVLGAAAASIAWGIVMFII